MVTQPLPLPRGMLAGAVVSGVATALLPPARIPVRVRRSIHLGLGLAATGYSAWAMGRPAPTEDEVPVPARLALASALDQSNDDEMPWAMRLGLSAALCSLVALSSAAGMGLDAASERALARRGVRHPRMWMGVAMAGLTVASSYAEARTTVRRIEERRLAAEPLGR